MKTVQKMMMLPLALTLMAGILASCSSSSSESGATDNSYQGKDKKITLTFTRRDDGSSAFPAFIKASADAYTKDHPNIIIKEADITAPEGDYYAKINLAMQSPDTTPDIVTEDTFILPSDANAGYLTDLSSNLTNYVDWNNGNFVDALKEGYKGQDGKVYAIPYTTDVRGIWYNKQIFKESGLGEQFVPKSWEDVLNAARQIKKAKGNDVIPFWLNSGKATGEATSMQTYEMLLYGTGERLLDKDGKWIVNSPGILNTLKFIDTVYKEKLGPPLSNVLNGQGNNKASREFMRNGKLGMYLYGNWTVGNYLKEGAAPWPEYKDVLGFAPMPTQNGDNGGTITLSGGWGFAIPAKSKHQAEAWDFIKFISSRENNLKLALSTGNLSPRLDVAEDPSYRAVPFQEISTGFLKNAAFRPKNDKYPAVSTELQSMVEAVATGTTPEKAMAAYGAGVTRLAGEDKVKEIK